MLGLTGNAGAQDALARMAALDLSQAVIEFEVDGTIVTANENFLKTLGSSLAEIKGQHHSLFVDASERESAAYREFWAKLKRGEFHSGEYKRIAKGGREVWIEATYNPIRGKDGKAVKVVKFASDITEKKLRRMADASNIAAIHRSQAVIEFKLDGTIVTANPNFLNAMGYSLGEIQGKHHSMFVVPAERESKEYREFWAALNRGEH